MLRFQHASFLTALALIPLLAMLFAAMLLWRRKKLEQIGSPEQVRSQLSGLIPGRDTLRFILQATALGAIILGCANLQKGGATETVERKGVDVMIALDLSKSMLAKDIQPDRLTRAKQFVERLTDKMSNDRVGLVVFAGKSYLQVPLTVDYSALKLILQTVGPDMIPTQGTVIGEAIRMCNQSFSSKERKFKSIILISDGEDHDETAVAAVNEARDQGAIVHTIGIGSPQGAPLFDPATNSPKLDEQGNQVITKLNEGELKSIADAGNGTYTLLGNTDAAATKITAAIDDMEQRNLGSVVFAHYENYFQYFLLAGILFLIAEWILPRSKNSKSASLIVKSLLWLPLLLGTNNAQAQSAKSLIASGNKLYAEKKFAEAANNYRAAMQKDTALAATAAYNLGNTLYRQQKTDEARKAFDIASKKSSDKNARAASDYNAGNTYMSEKKWQEAIDAYKAALRKNPGDADAKYNLSYALKMLKKEGGGGKNKDQKKDDKKEEQKDDQKNQQDQKDQDKEKQDNQEQNQADKKEGEAPQPQASKLSEKQAEQILNALQQEEKKLQEKNKKRMGTPAKLEKDW